MVPKDDAPKDFGQFKAVTLDVGMFKWYVNELCILLFPYLDASHWSLMQSAGVTGGQVADVLLGVRLLIHNFNVWPFSGELFVVKIDLVKAFDSVHVSSIIKMLQFLRVPRWLLLAYVKSLEGCSVVPSVNGEEAPEVPVEKGVRQG
eukprot:12424189-Karenia_brevis.AAC.1